MYIYRFPHKVLTEIHCNKLICYITICDLIKLKFDAYFKYRSFRLDTQHFTPTFSSNLSAQSCITISVVLFNGNKCRDER